jgi:methionine sulfoxide reductase heme-binding subunit
MRAPWRDKRGEFSATKTVGLAMSIVPAVWMGVDWRTGAYGPLPAIGFVYWSGIWATVALLVTLSVSPLRHVLRWGRLVDARRILGLAALVYSLVHVVAFVILFRWNMPAIAAQFTRPTILAASASVVILMFLGATSTDAWVARLGGQRWQRLHSLNYAASLLAITHFLLSPGVFGAQYLSSGLLGWLLTWRVLQRGGRAASPAWLAALAGVACAFAFMLELAWLWVYQAMPPDESLPVMLAWDEELCVWWVVLAVGVTVTAAALVIRIRRGDDVRVRTQGTTSPIAGRPNR